MIVGASPCPRIRASRDGSTGWLVIDRPERRNALDGAMWAAIPNAVQALDGDSTVRVIVVRGAGDQAFSAGADISEFGETRHDASAAQTYERRNALAFAALRGAAKPVVA